LKLSSISQVDAMATPTRTTGMSLHEPHYDVLSAAVAGTAATMLTLLAMLGGTGATTTFLKMLFDSQLLVLEIALVAGIAGIIQRRESQKKTLSHISALFLIIGTILVSLGAAIPI
jgi:hypothetical protein